MSDKQYGGVIWTNHALQRLEQRKIRQGDVWATWKRPDSSKYDHKKGAWVYKRDFGRQEFEVVAKKNDRGQWIILSAWSNFKGRNNAASKKETFLIKLLKKVFGR